MQPYRLDYPYRLEYHTDENNLSCAPNMPSGAENPLVEAFKASEAIDPSLSTYQFSAPLILQERPWHIRLTGRRKRKGFTVLSLIGTFSLLLLKCNEAVREEQARNHATLMRSMHGNIDSFYTYSSHDYMKLCSNTQSYVSCMPQSTWAQPKIKIPSASHFRPDANEHLEFEQSKLQLSHRCWNSPATDWGYAESRNHAKKKYHTERKDHTDENYHTERRHHTICRQFAKPQLPTGTTARVKSHPPTRPWCCPYNDCQKKQGIGRPKQAPLPIPNPSTIPP